MHAVVSLLIGENDRHVRSLWKGLEDSFGVRGAYKTPYPHFSYQIAVEYNFTKLERELKSVAGKSKKFTVHATGLGIFTGLAPVLHIPVTRTLELSNFHKSLWKVISPVGSGISPYYKAEFWTPHITLAQHDVDQKSLSKIIGRLSNRDFELKIKVDNLAIISDDGKTQSIRSRFKFSG